MDEQRRVAAVIPARNEAVTIADVVRAAQRASLIDEVIVVDNDSDDATAAEATGAGARVLRRHEPGKGEAMREGLAATDADIVVFLDADLIGLSPNHVDALARPVRDGEVTMVCGLFDRGPIFNPLFLHALPILTGERALPKTVFEALEEEELRGYKVEAALNSLCRDLELPIRSFVLPGLWHRTKEQKYRSPVEGFARKVGMLLVAVWSYGTYWLVRRRGRVQRRELRRQLREPGTD